NSGWVQSPGAAALADASQYPRLKAYVHGIVAAFAKDERVLAWDVWNEHPVAFVLPSPEEIVKRARATPNPRTWAHGASSPLPTFRGERANGFAAMAQEADDKRHLPVQEEPRSDSKDSNYNDTVDEQKRTLASALAWAGTHDPRYGDDA